MRLPVTIGRLAQSCEIYATTGGNLDPTAIITSVMGSAVTTGGAFSLGANLLSLLGATEKIGAVEKIALTDEREMNAIHSIGSFAFEPGVITPGKITHTIVLDKVELNRESALESFGFTGWNLFYQQVPLLLRQVFTDPSDDSKTYDIMYLNCWIKSMGPVTFDLSGSGSTLVRNSLTLICGKIINSKALLSSALGATTKVSGSFSVPGR